MTKSNTTRRYLVAGIAAATGGYLVASRAWAGQRTPGASEGPFYPAPSMRKPDTDNDLVRIEGQVEAAGGEVVILRGTVKSRLGAPLSGHRVEIWQCDVAGNYMHPSDPRSAAFDAAFQGFGHDITDADGAYVFRTIRPMPYPGRTPHIHVKVLDGDEERLTTQFYIAGEAANTSDVLFGRMTPEQAAQVSMTFVPGPDVAEARVDIIV
ncbi:MAG: protocatechuate 3,4-dioxygenase [Pseudomonadota bacterium]